MAKPTLITHALMLKAARMRAAGLDQITIASVLAVSYSTIRRALNSPQGKQYVAEARLALGAKSRVDLGLTPASEQPVRAGQVKLKLNWGPVPLPEPPKPSAAVYIPRYIPDEV